MANKKNNNRTWLQNLLNRYRMIVINETTFNEELSFRFSRLNILSIIIILLLVFYFYWNIFFLVSYTPIKEFIPGYTSTKVRKEAIRNTFLLDSLVTKFQKQDQFIKSIKSALWKNEDEGLLKEINKSNLESFNREFNRVKADSLLRLEVMQEDKYNLMPNQK